MLTDDALQEAQGDAKWREFDRQTGICALTLSELSGKLKHAQWALGRGCDEETARMVQSALQGLEWTKLEQCSARFHAGAQHPPLLGTVPRQPPPAGRGTPAYPRFSTFQKCGFDFFWPFTPRNPAPRARE
ncbi:hypothetical protein [Tateyamaria pelophila]|uniref:hypothetical protein n=1 Tax=Tateyamaria pelophila TaxID=328415 RepID=UPI001CBDDBEC|nr:hypothetical protein [Tateyamaria pelophila]